MTNSFWTPKSNPTTPVAALSRMQVETLESRVTPATLYGLLNNGTQLIQFDTATPNSTSTPLDITGLQAGEGLLGIDIRPANGLLYGLGASGRVYTLDPATAAITSTVVLTAPLNGTSFGVDFNPAADRLRVTSDLGQNLRINVDTGATIVDGALNGGSASLPSAAYTNSLAGTTTTQEYGIDAATDSLYLFSSPNGGTNALVGALGVDFSIASGFDISTNGLAYASLTVAGVTQLYSINLVTGAATAIGPIGAGNLNVGGLALVQPPRPVLAYSSDGIRLISFNTGSPNAAIASTAYVGLQPGEVVLGIDFRPANGLLYALGSTSRVYTIDPATATVTSTVNLTAALNGTSFGVDFNPAADRLRVTSDLGQNLRINVDTGATIVDGALNGGSASLSSVAYANSVRSATTTTEYGLDAATNSLYRFSNPNAGTNVLVGALGVDFDSVTGFDIAQDGTGYALLVTGGQTRLYSINLLTGAATLAPNSISSLTAVPNGLAIAPVGQFQFSAPTYTVAENGTMVTVTINRVLGANGPASVLFTASAGTATAGTDFTPVTQVVTFADGQTTATVTVLVLDNAVVNPTRTVNLTLSQPALGADLAATQATAMLSITDNEIPPVPPVVRTDLYAVGAAAGSPPLVRVFNSDGSIRYEFFAFDPNFRGGITVATGDVNGDNVEDVIYGAGAGGLPLVGVLDGATGQVISIFFAFDPAFRGGVTVAAGDLNGVGPDEIILGVQKGAPIVQVFSLNGTQAGAFFAFDPAFQGGVNVAAGDFNGDFLDEIVASTGAGGLPIVGVYNGQTFQTQNLFFAYDTAFRGGVTVAAGFTNQAVIITGPGAGGGPLVRAFSRDGTNVDNALGYPAGFTGGVNVTTTAASNGAVGPDRVLVGPAGRSSPVGRFLAFGGAVEASDLQLLPDVYANGFYVG